MGAYIEITAEGFPGIFPDFTFKGRHFIEGDRLPNSGDLSVKIETEEEWELVNDPFEYIRKVQTTMWRRYELHVFGHEATKINQWDKVQNLWIKVVDSGGNKITYKARVLNDIVGTRKRMGDTFKYDYTIDFIDINIANYSGKQPIANFLESRTLFEGNTYGDFDSFAGLNYLEFRLTPDAGAGNFANGIDDDFKYAWNQYYFIRDDTLTGSHKYRILTALQAKDTTVPREDISDVSGDFTEKKSRQVKYKAKRIVFYCLEKDKNIVERYCNYCHDGENKLTLLHLNGIGNFTSLESVNPKIKKVRDGKGIWRIEIELIYEKIDYLPYS